MRAGVEASVLVTLASNYTMVHLFPARKCSYVTVCSLSDDVIHLLVHKMTLIDMSNK